MKLNFKRFRSLIDLVEAFQTEESCIIYLEHIIWHNRVISPFDKKSQVYHLGNHRYMCKNTQKIFHVKIGTIFQGTKVPLRKWFMAIWLVSSHKKGISLLQYQDEYTSHSKNCLVHASKDKDLFYMQKQGKT